MSFNLIGLPKAIRERLPKGSRYAVTDMGHMIDLPGDIHPRVLKGVKSPIAGVREIMRQYILEKTRYEPHEFEINPLDHVTELIINAIVHGHKMKKGHRPVRVFFRYLEDITPSGDVPTFEVRVRDMGGGMSNLNMAELEQGVRESKEKQMDADQLEIEKGLLNEKLGKLKPTEKNEGERKRLHVEIKALEDRIFDQITSSFGPKTQEHADAQAAHETAAGTKGGLLIIKQVASAFGAHRLPEEERKTKNDFTHEVVVKFPLIHLQEATDYQEGQMRRLAPIQGRWDQAQQTINRQAIDAQGARPWHVRFGNWFSSLLNRK